MLQEYAVAFSLFLPAIDAFFDAFLAELVSARRYVGVLHQGDANWARKAVDDRFDLDVVFRKHLRDG